MKKKLIFLLLLIIMQLGFISPSFSQCSIPGGAILIDATFSGVSSINSGQVYYLPSGTSITINHTANNFTIQNGGTLLILGNAYLTIQMGNSNFTINGGTIQICGQGRFDINPGHDFTMQNGSNVNLGVDAKWDMCNFGHDITFNGGNINMNDFSTYEMSNFHNLVSNAVNLVKYTGTGGVSIGKGDPIIHTTGPDFTNYSNTDNVGAALSNSSHIDFVNDALGNVAPGSANYCGNKNAANFSTCRPQWASMNFVCGAASSYQDSVLTQLLLPIQLVGFTSKSLPKGVNLTWQISSTTEIDHFEIERSDNDQQFNVIEKVYIDLNKQVNELIYNFTDSELTSQTYEYRLKIVEKNNSYFYSQVLFVSPVSSFTNKAPECFPNPFRDNFKLTTYLFTNSSVLLEFFNNAGTLILKKQLNIESGNRQTTVNDLSSLPIGFYLLKISTNSGSYYQRLIKE